MFNLSAGFPILVFLLWLGVVIYLLVLATRLVKAVERISNILENLKK